MNLPDLLRYFYGVLLTEMVGIGETDVIGGMLIPAEGRIDTVGIGVIDGFTVVVSVVVGTPVVV